MLGCPLYNPIQDYVPSLFENVIPRSLKTFFQLENELDMNYPMEATALCHFRELVGLKLILMYIPSN